MTHSLTSLIPFFFTMRSLSFALRRSYIAWASRAQGYSHRRHHHQSRLLTSLGAFHPSPPPGTHGTPVFPDIKFSNNRPEALQRDEDPEAVYVVTGASRGIGLQMIKTIYDRTNGKLVACCRSPDAKSDLTDFLATIDRPERIEVVRVDLEDQQTIVEAGDHMKNKYNRIDVLLNVAGVLGDSKITAGPERALDKIDRRWMESTLAINTVGPVMLTQALVPLMKHRRTKKDGPPDRPVAIVANLSARVGSIADNGLGGWYSYRMSKSAINQFTRTMALEMKRHNVWCVALHPGTTATDLSKPFQANVKEGSLFPVEFTVEKLLAVINSMEEGNSGGFYDWAGQSLSF